MPFTSRRKLLFLLAALLLMLCLFSFPVYGEEETEDISLDEDILSDETASSPDGEEASSVARDAFIEDIISLGRELYEKADGKLQRAHYKGDIYVCKNFTVHLFRQTRDRYRMAEYPDKELKIPNNLPAVDVLHRENIFVMTQERAVSQDIRPLQILLVNLMPKKIQTEVQFSRLLGNTALQIELELAAPASHTPANTPPEHLQAFYKTFDEVSSRRSITGTNYAA